MSRSIVTYASSARNRLTFVFSPSIDWLGATVRLPCILAFTQLLSV
ncbi:MAG: hypothetical protein ACOH2K_11785 [Burkholderiaceae bacterium]